MAESKGEAGDCIQKELNKRSQQKEEAKLQVGMKIGEHVKVCKRAKEACCNWCRHDHKEYCTVGIEGEARKKNTESQVP